ncbi:hypothetical protein N9L06_04235 [Mariniblastus sp.]|nr:hypothetical protein [Mariniblastus sp.]
MLITVGGQFDHGAIVQTIDYSVDQSQRLLDVSEAFETSLHSLSEINFGNFCYPLKRVLKGYFIRAKQEFVVERLSPSFVGNGNCVADAKDDFCQKLHIGIQALINKRPFELTETEANDWTTIGDVVDITVFKNSTPLVVQQYGVVSHGMISRPCKIQWDNGHTDAIDLRIVGTPDFINFAPGQPIRALVRRDPVTRDIIDIPHVEKVTPLRSPQQIEESGLLERIGDSADLPETEWD